MQYTLFFYILSQLFVLYYKGFASYCFCIDKKSPQCRNSKNIFFEGALDPPARVWKSSLFLNLQSWQANNEEVDQSCPTPRVLDCSHSLGCNSTQLLGSNSPFNDVVTEEAIKVLGFIRDQLFILFLSGKSSKLLPLIAIIKITVSDRSL